MALPKLETPKYTLEVPSTGQSVEYRPFLVKEEKVLLVAQESDDNKTMMKAMGDIIDSCTFGNLNIKSITNFDLEYIFLKLRSKSVGEISEILLSCTECDTKNEVKINLDEIEIKVPKDKDKKIMLTGDVGITLKYISALDVTRLSSYDDDQSKLINETVLSTIENIFDKDNVYDMNDSSSKEKEEFINSLNRQQMEKIENFISEAPRLKKEISFTCKSCKTKNKMTLEGTEAFFSNSPRS